MAIQWGGYTNHLRVGIDVWTDGYDTNTPSINVYAAFYVGTDHWTWADDQALVLGGNAGGTWAYRNNMGYDGVIGIGTYTIGGQTQNYGGGPTYQFTGTVTGSYLGAGPSTTVYFSLPPRPPNVPLPPGIGVDSITPTSARIVVYAADGRGAGVDAYETVTSLPGGDFSRWTNDFGGGTGTVTNLQPYTIYDAATRAHNWVGWSDWRFLGQFRTGGTVPDPPSAPSFSNITQTTATATWSPPGWNGGVAITGYDVQVASDSGFTQGVRTLTVGSVNNIGLTALTSNAQSFVRVRAGNQLGVSGWSATGSFRTPMQVSASGPSGIQAPFGTLTLTGTDPGTNVASRSWTQVSGTPTVTLAGATTKTASFYAPGTLAGTTLTFRYTTVDTFGVSVSSNVSVVIRKAAHRAVAGGVEVPMDFRSS